ncbi:MAG TPA: 2-amino-4-hydroxy-6-hydroxymethyldihydropteridine diphosphokinase [Gammaproteobacteria bacterium]|nr:2-amino-4-hydroxy-6-hydroxymethyldihydropteridine diphosphokinase [Gammaproteobacteria bacterium]
MARIYISLGSNIDAENHLRRGVAALREHFGELILSPVYESEAVGFSGDNFLNLVAGLDTDKPVQDVVDILHRIEDENGRVRSGPRFSARTLDLDLLLYDDRVQSPDPGPELPRDEILKNAFVLWPLAEIAPELRHPVVGRTMGELWAAFDKTSQPIWPVPFDWSPDPLSC